MDRTNDFAFKIATANGTGSAVVDKGGKSWYFLVADYAFGASLYNDTSAVVKAKGGTVLHMSTARTVWPATPRHGHPTTDTEGTFQ